MSEEKLTTASKLFDVDSSGTISPTELKNVLGSSGKVSDDVIEQILKQADENNDGEIEFKEFWKLMGQVDLSG